MPPTPAPAAPPEGQGQQPAEGEPLDELEAALGDEQPATGADPAAEEWKPPTREEWQAQQAALEAEKAKLARARKQAQRLREGGKAQPAAATAESEEGGQPAGPDPQIATWQQRAVRAAAKAELLDRKANPRMVNLLLGQLRGESIDFNADDEPELDEWLDRMQEDYPDAFTPADAGPAAGTRRPMGAVDQGSAKGKPVGRQLSYGQRVLENSRKAGQGRPR
jgi:hypothetical protein